MDIYKQRLIEIMEDTTLMNRGEVDPSLEGILRELDYHFHPLIIKANMNFIEKYYRYMVIKEWLEFQEWRQGKNG
jgi:hypothetical protein